MGELLSYKEEVTRAMAMLGEDSRTLFIGQTAAYSGSVAYETLQGVSMDKRIELPIMEDAQMGMSIGLSLAGYIPISIYPRFDFLILAMNQLVNHLDKCKEMTHGEINPRVIIRTIVGASKPLYPGAQHCQDYTEGLQQILKEVEIVKLTEAELIVPAYMEAIEREGSTLLIEVAELHNAQRIINNS